MINYISYKHNASIALATLYLHTYLQLLVFHFRSGIWLNNLNGEGPIELNILKHSQIIRIEWKAQKYN